MVEPRLKTNLHKKLTKQKADKLDSIFSRRYQRIVRNNFTIYHGKKRYQLTNDQLATTYKQDKIMAEERIDKTIYFRLRGKYFNYKLFAR